MQSMQPLVPDTSGHDSPLGTVQWIAVTDVADLFAEAKMPRNSRTIRRYCVRGDLECQKTENALHQPQYFISKASVETYIEQQRTLLAGRPDVSGQAQPEPDISGQVPVENAEALGLPDHADRSGQVRTEPGLTGTVRTAGNTVVVEQLEARIKDKDAEIEFLRSELLHRRTTDSALHDVIAAFRANAESQRLAAAPQQPKSYPPPQSFGHASGQGTSEPEAFAV